MWNMRVLLIGNSRLQPLFMLNCTRDLSITNLFGLNIQQVSLDNCELELVEIRGTKEVQVRFRELVLQQEPGIDAVMLLLSPDASNLEGVWDYLEHVISQKQVKQVLIVTETSMDLEEWTGRLDSSIRVISAQMRLEEVDIEPVQKLLHQLCTQ